MRSKYPWLLALILVLGSLGLSIDAQKQTSPRTTWEYRSVFSTSGDLGYVLNDLGVQGWELVTVDVAEKDGFKGKTYYLKRAK